MLKDISADRSRITLPDLDEIARECGFVIRRSAKFSAGGFLGSLLSSVVTGLASLNQLVGGLKSREQASMARQSLHERFSARSTAFLIAVSGRLMARRFGPVVPALEKTAIRRIVIEDASAQVMPKANAGNFPAHGNHHGPTAGVKIDFTFDLIAGEVISHVLELGTTQDKVIGREVVAEIRRGDLVLRDMGYFALDEFGEIEDRGAWWLTRLPLTTGVVLKDGGVLEKTLRKRGKDVIDLGVFVGEARKECRLVAVRAGGNVAAQRRAERRKKAQECGKKACPKGLVRDGWHLMLTNLDSTRATVSQLMEVYRARWAVEIQFRAWKQSLNLTKALNRRSNEHHMQALVLAAMIAHQLGMRMAQVIGKRVGRARLSYEKLYCELVNYLLQNRGLATIDEFDPDPRHVTRDKRKRRSPIESGILALT